MALGWLEKWKRKRNERRVFANANRQQIFNWIYDTNKWGSEESVSGKGSELGRTEALREWFPELIQSLEISSLLDLPCGDLNWIDQLSLPEAYMGADIVSELIERNRERYPTLEFRELDICHDDLPDADMLLMRDLFVHLSFEDIQLALDNLSNSRYRYVACTTYPGVETNVAKGTGNHRRLNMCLSPIAWPEPMILFDEREKHGKALGVWEFEAIKQSPR